MGSMSIWHWLIVLAIVVVVFGTKKLGNIGKDLGSAVKGFKDGMRDGQADKTRRGLLFLGQLAREDRDENDVVDTQDKLKHRQS